jgi:hypothetical protein
LVMRPSACNACRIRQSVASSLADRMPLSWTVCGIAG